jgi:Spy/CpxP family protein refolding chaperone
MRFKWLPVLIVLSVAFNLAFIGVWAATAVTGSPGRVSQDLDLNAAGGIWCPLHRQLGVSPQQWDQIEPRLQEFRTAAAAICQGVNGKRAEMIGLLAAHEPDRAAIVAKQEEILAGQRSMQDLVIRHLLGEKQVLTPEQQTRLFDLLRQRSACTGHGPLMGWAPGLSGPDTQPDPGLRSQY